MKKTKLNQSGNIGIIVIVLVAVGVLGWWFLKDKYGDLAYPKFFQETQGHSFHPVQVNSQSSLLLKKS